MSLLAEQPHQHLGFMVGEEQRSALLAGTSSQASTSLSAGSPIANDAVNSGVVAREDGFILHKVTKLDTLAGLAIKYHVTVSDIKRANGILSDNAMFAREHIKIPTGQLPVGEEAQVLFARLMSGYGRDASLNAKERKAPGTVSITQLPGSPSASRSSAVGSEAIDDEPGTPYSRRSDKSSEPGDVELIERSLADTPAYGYGSDRVRRRTRGESNLSSSSSSGAANQLSSAAEAAVGWLSSAAAQAAHAAQAALPSATGLHSSCLPAPGMGRRSSHNAAVSDQGTGSSSSSTWQQLSHAVVQGGSSLVKKIQKAASQPVLLEQAGGFGDVADAMLVKGSASRVPSLTSNGAVGSTSIDLLARGTGLSMMPPRKDTKGD